MCKCELIGFDIVSLSTLYRPRNSRILDIGTVHGKFYKRLKIARDRFIPLRFRVLAENEEQEE